jgi:hypothetical protein
MYNIRIFAPHVDAMMFIGEQQAVNDDHMSKFTRITKFFYIIFHATLLNILMPHGLVYVMWQNIFC